MSNPLTQPSTSAGYACVCGLWVMPGTHHHCPKYASPAPSPVMSDWHLNRIATALERIAAAFEDKGEPGA